MKSKFLVTAFVPFLHHRMNSSEIVLQELLKEREDIVPLLLPVSFQNSFVEFKKHWDGGDTYKSVIMLGQANGRKHLSLERVALNWMESKNPDNDGECPPGKRIIEGAPDSYLIDFFPTSWTDTLSSPSSTKLAEVSLSAGAYVCNNLYFKVLHELRNQKTKALFVHLPLLPEQTLENPESPSLDLHSQKDLLHKLLDLIAEVN